MGSALAVLRMLLVVSLYPGMLSLLPDRPVNDVEYFRVLSENLRARKASTWEAIRCIHLCIIFLVQS